MGRKYPKDCCPIPPGPGSSLANNNNDNQMIIELDHAKCCPVPDCPCEREELIKNGGFEMFSPDHTQVFAHWRAVNQVSDTTVVFESFSPTYEGFRAAQFQTNPSPPEPHAISLQQHVTVTPGCIYQFSFAENFLGGPGGAVFEPSLIGRVYYTDCAGSQFDLIVIPVAKANIPNNTDKGYTFHQKTADIPVPCDVSKVTVQFDFTIEEDTGGIRWLLDGVSLRAVSSASSCSRDGCASSMDICRPVNLVRNGDFEDFTEFDPDSPFLYWWQVPESGNGAIVETFNSADYEGLFQALFVSLPSDTAQLKTVSLRQIVTVRPGCRLELSFAEYFLERGESAGDTPRLIGRVFWVNDSGTEFDLITVSIAKINDENDVDKGYSFHKRTADIPVPCNVTSVYVQFDFSVTDIGETQWALDAVQLRAVPWESACCQELTEVAGCAGSNFLRCQCESGELIRNGGFEVTSIEPGFPFHYWEQINPQNASVTNNPDLTNVAYEGLAAARFISSETVEELNKSVALQQTVTVTPGCIYKLSFAENLLVKGNGTAAAIPVLTARVVYVDNFGNDVDLIIIPIFKFNSVNDPNRGYTFHEAVTIAPVPCDVSVLIVRFEYFENSTTGSSWLLDGVSLRAVYPASACCKEKRYI